MNAPRNFDWRIWLMLLWAAGAAAAFARMMAACIAMWRIQRTARPFPDDSPARELAQGLGIRHRVRVLESRPGSMPMTFGLLRPAIFMPPEATGWSEERRRIVLLHELAHVRRGDAATHWLARTALNLNWWNPLAWSAWREFLKERECATDDLVLGAGRDVAGRRRGGPLRRHAGADPGAADRARRHPAGGFPRAKRGREGRGAQMQKRGSRFHGFGFAYPALLAQKVRQEFHGEGEFASSKASAAR